MLAAPARAEIELPLADPGFGISIRGDDASHWQQGSYEVWHVRGNCEIRQGQIAARAPEAIFWIDRAESFSGQMSKIIAYLEGSSTERVAVDFGGGKNPQSLGPRRTQRLEDRAWLGRFHTTAGIQMSVPVSSGQSPVRPAIYDRGTQAWLPNRQVTYTEPIAPQFGAGLQTPPNTLTAGLPTAAGPETFGRTMGGVGRPAPNVAGRPAPNEAADPSRRYPLAGDVQSAQFTGEEIAPPTATPPRPANRRVTIEPRNHGRWQFRQFNEDGPHSIMLAHGGVQVRAENVDNPATSEVESDTIAIEADNIVAWIPRVDAQNPRFPDPRTSEVPYEIYVEGNIVFRQGDRVIYADRMYYNITQEYGVVMSAEMLTPVQDYQGLLRLRAEVLQQLDRQHFQAYNAALTSSRIGVPRYWFQSGNVQVEDIHRPLLDPFSGQPLVDPVSGEAEIDHQLMATSRNNFLFLAQVPVFYWPVIATDLTKPTYYLDRIRIKSDRVFGQQLLLDWDAYQLFGIRNKPLGTKWGLSTDFLSERGIGLGTNFKYEGDTPLGFPGPFRGFIDAWGLIHEEGVDNLGFDRREVPPEAQSRGRILANHRHYMQNDWMSTFEFGLISDRNFLEQYYEQEWDTLKDQSTGLELKKYTENRSLSITADARLNDFFTQTEWLPRVDHFTFGQSLLFDRLSWHEHSHVGYARLQVADTPTNPVDLAKFSPMAWEVEQEGIRAATRQEVDLPVELGPVKIVPYVLGEAAHWSNDINSEEVTRLFGQTGIRASLPMWTANPSIQSELLNLNGLAHKVVFDSEFLFADASEDLSRFPLYDKLDDDAQEAFRRRMVVNTFGQPVGTFVPLKYDERFYALRSGLQSAVSSPSTEIADDLTAFRAGVRQRWQTKRGLPGQERIIDWITLDVDAILFPNPERDNFGANLGLVDYDFAWHVGDRLTFLSDGFYDFFDQGLRQVTIGGLLSRPEYGSLYLGFRSTEGPISANVFNATIAYRMSEKWIGTAGTSVDFSSSGNIGQNIALTRIGESFLVRVGFIVDNSRNNVGLQFTIEPRFLPSSRLGRVGGVQIPPAGAMGLE
ncbi:MAG TPA: organic solvent tolerance protein OstA [Pirellulaceae bacterium]|nr:organic solvent tolerance protein OstA [Pirellulaceae bacterium]